MSALSQKDPHFDLKVHLDAVEKELMDVLAEAGLVCDGSCGDGEAIAIAIARAMANLRDVRRIATVEDDEAK